MFYVLDTIIEAIILFSVEGKLKISPDFILFSSFLYESPVSNFIVNLYSSVTIAVS